MMDDDEQRHYGEDEDAEDARMAERDAAREAQGRALYEEHRERVARLISVLPAPPEEHVVFDAHEPGVSLIDVIEATVEVGGKFGGGLSARDAYVRLPHGYASVEFLRMLFAVSG